MFACLHAPGNGNLLLECASHFSPLIEETSPDTVVFDIRGLRLICGTPEQIAREILARNGIPANLALAANPDAAVHAACGISGVTILPPGEEGVVLAPLPLYLLGGSPEFARTMDLWGIRTFGEFAELPALGVTSRLAAEGTLLQSMARGVASRQLRLRTDVPVFAEMRELEHVLDNLDPLLFVISGMMRDVCSRLQFHAYSTNEIRLRMKLDPAGDHCTRLQLPAPMLNSKVLLKLLHLQLSGRPPHAPVEKIYLEAMPVEPRTTQHGLFLPAAPEPEKLEITLARIRALVGAENVGAPRILNTHRPDAVAMAPFVTGAAAKENQSHPLRPKLALRRIRPPSPAQVWCTGDGVPTRIVAPVARGSVVACAGPWKTSGEWWTGTVWNHEEWDVEIRDASVSRIYRDHMTGKWFVEGNYD